MHKFAKNAHIFPHMRSHFSAFLCILSNVNTHAIAHASFKPHISVMPHICSIYAAYFAKFRTFFPHILHQNGQHILRKISAINRYPYPQELFGFCSLTVPLQPRSAHWLLILAYAHSYSPCLHSRDAS